MLENEVESRVRSLVASRAGVDAGRLDADEWVTSQGVDSLGLVILREDIEAAFEITIPDTVWLDFSSLEELIQYVAEQRRGHDRSASDGASPSADAAEKPRRGGRWLSSSGLFCEHLEIGMPLTGRVNLSESPLLKHVGDLRWDHISALCGVPSRDIADADGNRLYPTFFYVDLAFPSDRPMASFGENDELILADTLGRYGASMLDGTTYFLPPGSEPAQGVSFAGPEEAVEAGIPAVRLSNIFVMQFDGAGWLKKSRPANPGFERIPELGEVPDSYPLIKEVKEAGRFHGPDPDGYLPMAEDPLRVEYEIVPDRDLNGAGLIYFANYPVFLDVCERRALQSCRYPLDDGLLDRRTVVRRRSAYLSNASAKDSIVVEIEPWVKDPRGVETPENADIRLRLDYRMYRESDGWTMMVSTCEKVIYGASFEEAPFAEALLSNSSAAAKAGHDRETAT